MKCNLISNKNVLTWSREAFRGSVVVVVVLCSIDRHIKYTKGQFLCSAVLFSSGLCCIVPVIQKLCEKEQAQRAGGELSELVFH